MLKDTLEVSRVLLMISFNNPNIMNEKNIKNPMPIHSRNVCYFNRNIYIFFLIKYILDVL